MLQPSALRVSSVNVELGVSGQTSTVTVAGNVFVGEFSGSWTATGSTMSVGSGTTTTDVSILSQQTVSVSTATVSVLVCADVLFS